jgi:hypothetical protein
MSNFLYHQISLGASDSAVKSQRTATAVLLRFLGYQEEEVHSPLVALLMRPINLRTRHKDKESEIWELSMLLDYICTLVPRLESNQFTELEIMFVSLTLTMVFTVARLAELNRMTISRQDENVLVIDSLVLKKP